MTCWSFENIHPKQIHPNEQCQFTEIQFRYIKNDICIYFYKKKRYLNTVNSKEKLLKKELWIQVSNVPTKRLPIHYEYCAASERKKKQAGILNHPTKMVFYFNSLNHGSMKCLSCREMDVSLAIIGSPF